MADISGYLTNIKNAARGEDVRDSIISALKKINQDNPADVQPLNVTANGTYSGQGGIVYNPVTVNVPEGASQALSLSDLKVTENGEYTPEDGEAYRKIIVEVPQQVMEIMDVKTIYLEEGAKDYFAYDDGYDGYAQVSVVSGGGGGGGGATYTVNFMDVDGTTLLQAKTGVPFGGGAVYTGPQPTSPGMRFVGWSPNPLNVRSNMTCVPRFENDTWSDTQILDDWITIAKNVQTDPNHYPIGSWKLLEIPPHTAHFPSGNEITAPTTYYYMRLVAKQVDQLEGQNGYANTTWLSTNSLWIADPDATHAGVNTASAISFGYPDPGSDEIVGWPHEPNVAVAPTDQYYHIRGYLIRNFTSAFPADLLKYVKRVVKYSRVCRSDFSGFLNDAATVDWFWIPSSRELGRNDGQCETVGPVYFTPEEIVSDPSIRGIRKYSNGEYTAYATRSMLYYQDYGSLFGVTTVGRENTNFDFSDVRCNRGIANALVPLGFCL